VLKVDFVGASASSVEWNNLVDASDISEGQYVRGKVTDVRKLFGAMKFNEEDLFVLDGKLSEQSAVDKLLDTIPGFVQSMSDQVSQSILGGPWIDRQKAAGSNSTLSTSIIEVYRPERFKAGMKVIIRDVDASSLTTGYVYKIDKNNDTITLTTARIYPGDGNSPTYIDLSNATKYPLGFKIYLPGGISAGGTEYGFDTLRASLLSAANGGSSTLYGVTKLNWEYTQSLNFDGSSMTATSILEDIFDAMVKVRRYSGNKTSEAWMSFKLFGLCMKILELQKGAFNQADKMDVNAYGWQSITIQGVKGTIKLVAINEAEDDVIMLMNPKAIKFHTYNFIQRIKDANGNMFYVSRATTGYSFITDHRLQGNFVLNDPSSCGIIYSIPLTLA
jgi:hypothetical protein